MFFFCFINFFLIKKLQKIHFKKQFVQDSDSERYSKTHKILTSLNTISGHKQHLQKSNNDLPNKQNNSKNINGTKKMLV